MAAEARARGSATRSDGPRSEGEFIRALRDWALLSVDLFSSNDRVLGLTSSELESRSGLSRPSVTGLIKRFESILEVQDLEGNPMHRPYSGRRWTIDPGAGVVVGVELDQELACIAVSDLNGRIQERTIQGGETTADETIDWAVDEIRTLLRGRPPTDVVGVGISLATPVEHGRGIAWAAPSGVGRDARWADWQFLRVREHLRERLRWNDVPFLLDNDANLSALAEYVWGAARPPRLQDQTPYTNILYVEWSRGIGAGLILGGELYRGGEGVAGELGHTVVRNDPGAPVCQRCGNVGCLETIAGWDAVLRPLLQPASQDRLLTQEDLEAALVRADRSGSPEREAFESAARELGRALGPVIHLLNPELVIIGGDVGEWGYDVVRTPLLDSLRRYTMPSALARITIVASRLHAHAALQGSIALVVRNDRRDDPLLAFLQRQAHRHV